MRSFLMKPKGLFDLLHFLKATEKRNLPEHLVTYNEIIYAGEMPAHCVVT